MVYIIMTEFNIYMRFTVAHEALVKVVDTDSEFNAVDLAFEYEDEIFDKIKQQYGDSVEFMEFIAIKNDEDTDKYKTLESKL